MFKKFAQVTAFTMVFGVLAGTVYAQSSVSDEEKKLCLEAINDLTDGKPSADAVKLCSQGKTEAAMEKALNSQGG